MTILPRGPITTQFLVAAFAALCLQVPAFGQSTTTFDVGVTKYKIDRYPKTPDATKRPVVVLVHGVDGMDGQSGKQIGEFAGELEEAGFLVVVPHFFGDDDGSVSAPLTELIKTRLAKRNDYLPRVAAAVDYASQERDADAGRLGLVGFSLGGGLVLEHAESAPAGVIKAVVDYFGFIPDEKIYKNAGKLPPTLVFHNEKDMVVPIDMSKALLAALTAESVEQGHKFYDNGDPERLYHTFTPGGKADVDSRSQTVNWLKTHLK